MRTGDGGGCVLVCVQVMVGVNARVCTGDGCRVNACVCTGDSGG